MKETHKLYIGDYKGKAIVRGRRNMRKTTRVMHRLLPKKYRYVLQTTQNVYDVVLENLLDKAKIC